MKTTVFEVMEIVEYYGLSFEVTLGLYQNQKDAREYFESKIESHPNLSFKIRVRTIH